MLGIRQLGPAPSGRPAHVRTGAEPWWFETGHDWGDGVMYAHGVENRFADWSLDRVFGDLRGFVAERSGSSSER